MILIVGASGAVGIPTIKNLVKRGATVRALTSNEKSAERLKSLGVAETVIGDFRFDADVARAVDGAETVMHIPPRFTSIEAEVGLRVVEAAKAAGVGYFVFSSAYHPQMRKLDHHWSKLLAEEAVIESGMAFTILQPSMFMQNIRVEWQAVTKDGVYPRPYSPDRKMSTVDTEDLGEASAIVLTDPSYRGATFELCSGSSLTHTEMAEIFTTELGRPVKAVKRDLGEWESWARKRGWEEWSITAYKKMCNHYDAYGYPGGNPMVLRTILGREPTDYATFAARFVKEQGG